MCSSSSLQHTARRIFNLNKKMVQPFSIWLPFECFPFLYRDVIINKLLLYDSL